jgi:hypothetical protein
MKAKRQCDQIERNVILWGKKKSLNFNILTKFYHFRSEHSTTYIHKKCGDKVF